MTIDPDFMPDSMEGSPSPKIRRLDIVVGVCVKAFVGRHELVELMNNQEDGIQLPRVGHEIVKRDVGSVFSETERVIGAVRQRVWIRAAPSGLYAGSGDGSREILNPQPA